MCWWSAAVAAADGEMAAAAVLAVTYSRRVCIYRQVSCKFVWVLAVLVVLRQPQSVRPVSTVTLPALVITLSRRVVAVALVLANWGLMVAAAAAVHLVRQAVLGLLRKATAAAQVRNRLIEAAAAAVLTRQARQEPQAVTVVQVKPMA